MNPRKWISNRCRNFCNKQKLKSFFIDITQFQENTMNFTNFNPITAYNNNNTSTYGGGYDSISYRNPDQIRIDNLINTVVRLSDRVDKLEQHKEHLEQRILELEYAPPGHGGPMYETAKMDFESLS